MFTTAFGPVAAGKTLSNTVTFGTVMATILLTGKDTDDSFSLIELSMRSGTEPPYHIHECEDETFYIIEGHLSVMVDGVIHECHAGQTIFLPRGIPHTFRIRSAMAKALVLVTPSGFERYFQMIGKPASTLEVPSAENALPDYAAIAGRAAEQCGVVLASEQPRF